MPDGRRYGDDFYAWTQFQAQVLRTMRRADNRLDRERGADEIEDLGKSERDAARSQIVHIIEHLLELGYSPAADPHFDWMASIVEARHSTGSASAAGIRHSQRTRTDRVKTAACQIGP